MNFVHLIYFSPTGNTKKVCQRIGLAIASAMRFDVKHYDFTTPQKRLSYPDIKADDIVILGTPVYAGRVPNLMVPYISGIQLNGAKSITVVTYGNRNYDDALIELSKIVLQTTSVLVGAAAFVGEHSFSTALAAGRPNYTDLDEAETFAHKALENIRTNRTIEFVNIASSPAPLKPHYIPKFADGKLIDLRKVKPITSSACISCKLCVQLCPMDAINFHIPSEIEGVCIKCCACVKRCPTGAKYFDSEAFLFHKNELEEKFYSVDRVNEKFV